MVIWLYIIFILTIGLIMMGCEWVFNGFGELFTGNVGKGILCLFIILFLTIGIIVFTLAKVGILKKPKKKKKLAYWDEIKNKASTSELTTDELYEHIKKVFEAGQYADIEEKTANGLKILKGTNRTRKSYQFLSLLDTNLDFDKLADITAYIEKNSKKNSKLYYVMQQVPKQVYTELFKKCLVGAGIGLYDTQSVLKESNRMLDEDMDYEMESTTINEDTTNSNYQKLFPHMMSSDEDPEELQELDDMMVMETIDEDDDDFFDDMF